MHRPRDRVSKTQASSLHGGVSNRSFFLFLSLFLERPDLIGNWGREKQGCTRAEYSVEMADFKISAVLEGHGDDVSAFPTSSRPTDRGAAF